MKDENKPKEFSVETHGWWITSRPYRVMTELVIFSFLSLFIVVHVLSRAGDDPTYRFFNLNPLYILGAFAGCLGGTARSFVNFRRRENFNMLKSDYWKHSALTYIGLLFGFITTLIIQSGLKMLSVPNNILDPGGMSFLTMLCLLAGLFADKAERKFLAVFDSSFPATDDKTSE